MSPRAIRRLVIATFVTGIGGMILGSIKDNNGLAIGFGLLTAVAALGLILVTSVAPPEALRPAPPDVDSAAGPDRPVDPVVAADVEARIEALITAGADENEVRSLVSRAVDLGRGRRPV